MKIEHIAIWTKQLEEMKDFYTHYFHGTASEKYINPKKQFESYFIQFQSGTRLELMRRPDLAPGEEPAEGYAHMAFSLGSRQQVDDMTRRFEEEGFQVVGKPRVTGDGYYESVIRDPDGNLVELTV
ncbi:VOC family protein [Bacillus swezeyi]|uniref:Glyoxalase/bleomycin resistance/extradiol dioxygenase family protein n=1 Tax=Bacillus swezeyi TaxID=1925020 RepID=A0A1R1QFN4_9BACI|nr:VOC family protein [Bacillus swezeyi]MEC1262533.1 VOC family protein [Bacillus swezeyi]MED2926758.1 VOC family protein [Bacillus swezeyi]MED2943464.1 VOC family protein [Bacillus swezeyi]MED2965680.1 VOC family protein [Bacillus swezeyi]MED2978371.1 VOC family protein [Bacillus swezeyi]